MNRTDKIQKLSHAVRDWRGGYNQKTGKWTRLPKLKAKARVIKWLVRLGLDAEAEMKTLSAFQSYKDFYAWLRKLSEKKPGSED